MTRISTFGHPSYFVLLSIVLIINGERRFVSRLCFRLQVNLKEAINLVDALERPVLIKGGGGVLLQI